MIRAGVTPSRAFQWGAIAAALVVLLFGAYMLLANIQLKNQIAQIKEEHSALKQREQQLQRDLIQRHSFDSGKEKELALAKEQLELLERQLADRQSAPATLFALSLSPQHRDINQIPKFVIPATTEFIVVTLKLEGDGFSFYKTVLKDPASDTVLWQGGKDKSVNHSIVVRFPANILQSQNYFLEISGISKSGNAEIISSYPFKVLKQ